MPRPHAIIALTGPTAVGKSALALDVAERHGLEIVSADSRQVYRRLVVGTAQPSAEDRRQVRHHLVDYIEPDEEYSVARYRGDGERVLTDLAERQVGALVVGGTGHYLQALLDGIEPPAVPPRTDRRTELEAVAGSAGPAVLHARLANLDPEAARSIPATNVRRVIRALEVIAETGLRFSELGRRRTDSRSALRLALTLPRQTLYERADIRVDRMIQAGWLDEVRELLDLGYDARLPALSSTGYRELIAHLRGELPLNLAVQRIKWSTHAYIRRQYTWLRRRPAYRWLTADAEGLARAADMIARYVADPRAELPDI